MEAAIREIVDRARRVVILTGAGISAESGIQTFRSAGGLWGGMKPEQVATPEAFSRDPEFVWRWYDMRRIGIAAAEPNAGHRALVRLEGRKPTTVVTQNVDGLHEGAGSRAVLRLHGSIWITRCLACGSETEDRRTPLPELPPHCTCGGLLRPGVVWFGEALPRAVWDAAERETRLADLLLVIGTSAQVWPAASLAHIGLEHGAAVIEINPEETPLSDSVSYSIRGLAGEILPALIG